MSESIVKINNDDNGFKNKNNNDDVNSSSPLKRKPSTSGETSFLSSMTFATAYRERNFWGCNCCDDGEQCVQPSYDTIPDPILRAIQEHKRQKLLQGPMVRSQDRSLKKRSGSVSVWQWTLPPNADPLLEYGTSHRFVMVEHLPKSRIVKSIGEGIVGSRSEEKSRPCMDWEQGGIYWIPGNKGKAIAFVNSSIVEPKDPSELAQVDTDEDGVENVDSHDEDGGLVVLTIAKIHAQALEVINNPMAENAKRDENSNSDSSLPHSWANTLQSVAWNMLQNPPETILALSGRKLGSDDARVIQNALLEEPSS